MRTPVRFLLLALVAALPLSALAQRRDGVYVPAGGSGTPWSLNENHTLIWGGKPYLPVGLRIDGTPAAVQAAQAAGVHDVIVDLPAGGAGWDETLAALKTANMRYLIRLDSLAPMASGIAVDPQAYRIAGIDKQRTVTLELPGATGAYVVLASRRDGSIAASGHVPVIDGLLSYDAKPGGQIEHVLLVYPETSSFEQVDFWERLDAHRDELLSSLKKHAPGPGLRGFVDPMGRTLALPGRELRFVPTSPYFRMELRDALEKKYRAVKTAMQAWGLGANDLQSFDDLSRLVPLWQGSRGVGLFLDPSTGRTYSGDNRHSSVWSDLAEVVNTAGTRRFARFVTAIRSVANVPVVQEWAGWAAPYENSSPALDGVGMRATGTSPSAIVETASRAASTVARWSTNGWLVATDVDPGSANEAAAQLPGVLDDLTSLGARGVFVRTESPAVVKAIASEAAKRAEDVAPASQSLSVVYFPENARNPATPQRLTGGRWWLPAPYDGNRIDLGSQFSAYRMRGPQGDVFAIWAKTPGRYRLRITDAKNATFTSIDGHDPAPKTVKGSVEVALTEVPLFVSGTSDVPIPELALTETLDHMDSLMDVAAHTMRDIAQERMYFRDFLMGFDRNPGGSFPQLKAQLDSVGQKVGDTTWIEVEKSVDNNLSDAANLPGCSGGGALLLRSPIAADYYVNLNIPVKTISEQEVWLAAKIPAERRGDVTLEVAGQVLRIVGEPVSPYSDGFAWYRLGSTSLRGGSAKAKIRIAGNGSPDLAFDVLALSPRPFVPNGVTRPDPILYPPPKGK